MARILFALLMLLGVAALEMRIHPPARWTGLLLANEADLDYLRDRGASLRELEHGFELKMNATGYSCLQNLRDCQALRLKVRTQNLQNSITGSDNPRQQVIRQRGTFAVVEEPQTEPLDLVNQQQVDLVVLDIGSKVLRTYEMALVRYETEHGQ